jgi:pilus assembly protein Flp/PilA
MKSMLKIIVNRFKHFLRDDDGPTAVEYAVMVSLIAVAVISSVGQVANATKNTFNAAGNQLVPALTP